MSVYTEFFLKGVTTLVEYETLAITHPSFSQGFYLIRNSATAQTFQLEDASFQTFTPTPMQIEPSSHRTDLDYAITVTLGDLGELLPQQLDLIAAAGTWSVKPTVVYRTFPSTGSIDVLSGPFVLEVSEFSFNSTGAVFTCAPVTVNRRKTGVPYISSIFPTLRGFQ